MQKVNYMILLLNSKAFALFFISINIQAVLLRRFLPPASEKAEVFRCYRSIMPPSPRVTSTFFCRTVMASPSVKTMGETSGLPCALM